MKTASQAVVKWQARAGQAGQDYAEGARTTDKDQAARATAAIPIMQAALTEAFAQGRVAKGLARSGKAGWLAGVEQKGVNNYPTGVSSDLARDRYTANSGRYDAARRAADTIPRGPRGSAANLNRVAAVANALRAVKTGK